MLFFLRDPPIRKKMFENKWIKITQANTTQIKGGLVILISDKTYKGNNHY